jgi:hypothetical protein
VESPFGAEQFAFSPEQRKQQRADNGGVFTLIYRPIPAEALDLRFRRRQFARNYLVLKTGRSVRAVAERLIL